jgi:arylformamidase
MPLIPEFGRRAFVAGASSLAAGTAIAQSAPPAAPSTAARPKGPLVWRDMDQAELDAAYDQSVWAPTMRQVIGRAMLAQMKLPL